MVASEPSIAKVDEGRTVVFDFCCPSPTAIVSDSEVNTHVNTASYHDFGNTLVAGHKSLISELLNDVLSGFRAFTVNRRELFPIMSTGSSLNRNDRFMRRQEFRVKELPITT